MHSKRLILALVLVLICAFCRGQDDRVVPSALSELKQTSCSPDAAYEQALTVREGTKFSRFMAFVKKFNLGGELKKLTRGKALFIPSDTTLNNKLRSLGLVDRFGSYDFNTYKLGPYRRSQFLRWVELRLVRSRQTFNKLLNKQPGLALGKCQVVEGADLYGSKNTIEPARPSNCSKPHFDAFMTAQARSIGADGVSEWVGRGYNILTADPLRFDVSDPGFAQTPFSMEGGTWFTKTTGDSKCTQSATNTVSSSAAQLKKSSTNSLGVDAEYGPAAFSSSATWGSSSESSSAETAATIEASTDVIVATGTLNDVLNLQLCSTFKDRVVDLIKRGGDYNEGMRQILDQYGSHYVYKVDFGGRARLVIKTSAKQLAEVQQSSSDVTAAVKGSYGAFKVGVEASSASEESKKVFNALKSSSITQASSPVATVPSNQDGSIDCAGYYGQLQAADTLSPLNYKLRPISDLFTEANMKLWKDETGLPLFNKVKESQLLDFGVKFQAYVKGCLQAGGGCPKDSDKCNPGFYGNAPECKNCYGGSGAVGTPGNCHPSQSCDQGTGACSGDIPRPRNTLYPGDRLNKGDSLYSDDQKCRLEFTADDNLILKTADKPGGQFFDSQRMPNSIRMRMTGNWGSGSEKINRLEFSHKNYGNLILLDESSQGWWATKTSNYQECTPLAWGESVFARLENDCNFVIYKQQPSGTVPIWSWYDSLQIGHWCVQSNTKPYWCTESGCR